MDDETLTQLLWHDAGDPSDATPFCPEDQLIASYFEGALSDPETDHLKNHLAECRYCQARLGNLERGAIAETSPVVPADVLAEAKQMGHAIPPGRWHRKAPAWAAVAVVVLATGLFFTGSWQQTLDQGTFTPTQLTDEEEFRQLRSPGRLHPEIRFEEPEAGAILAPDSQIRWAGVPEVDRYELTVLSASGDPVWTERLSGNDWLLSGTDHLIPGEQYYLRVTGTLRDGTTVSSRFMAFRYQER